ncbi:hypothetical protein [Streptomyces sp. CC228A]|uniref:hypothetical protein n=1 Tax=Streptomyces sp. CC228A TaxID=2898186 RepID=UPI001F469986|nr:hypothetical protein [Streptomyces sp. CC228A]
MKIRHVGKLRRAGAAAALAAALAVSVTACNGDDGAPPPASSASASVDKGQDKDPGQQDDGKTLPDTSKVVATLKGNQGIEMVLYSVTRDEGGFLTVGGEIKNTAGKRYTVPPAWSGEESAIVRTGRSLAAMTLVDSKEKKRYYVLRDTDNRPLTTTGFSPWIQPNESVPFFAQFPAPPASTTKVDLQFPGFPNAPIEIS